MSAVVLAISLKTGDTIRPIHRYDVTTTMPDTVWRDWRAVAANRRDGEHVRVTLTHDGVPVGEWTADHRWPRPSADAIRQARLTQGAPAA